jgi:hypothetical protein
MSKAQAELAKENAELRAELDALKNTDSPL